MKGSGSTADIRLRTELRSGDIGAITWLHGVLYQREYNYNYHFESYVAAGLHEFAEQYTPGRNRLWICEHDDTIAGSLVLMDRGEAAQLRFFLLAPDYRGRGLGARLMNLYMEALRECGYRSSYLWTTHELTAAAALYTRHGFVLTQEHGHTVWGKQLTEQRYDLVLS